MPKFVILHHQMPVDPETGRGEHWDLMLEENGILRTWALNGCPKQGSTIDGHQLPNHRIAYLDYQGPVSGNRGTVTQVAKGSYETISRSNDTEEIVLRMKSVNMRVRIAVLGGERVSINCQAASG